MAEPNLTQCFVEGFKYKTEIENLKNEVLAIREFEERETATPLAVASIRDMETNVRSRIKKLRENKCVSESRELENAVSFHTAIMLQALRQRNWLRVSNQLLALNGLLSGW